MLKASTKHVTGPTHRSGRPAFSSVTSKSRGTHGRSSLSRPAFTPRKGRACLSKTCVLQRSLSLRDAEVLNRQQHPNLSSTAFISNANNTIHTATLPKLPPVWELVATLDALAVPWGLKQLSMAFMTSHMLGLAPPAEYYMLNWAIAVLCNLYDQYKGQGSIADMINVPIRMSFIKRHQGAIQAHLAVSLGLVATTLALLPPTVLQAFVPGILTTSAYWLPVLPNGTTAKQIPAAKNLFAAGVETFALVKFALAAVPASAAANVAPAAVAATSVFFVAVNMALAVLADVRDVEGDRVAGTRSIPVIFGVPAALNVAVGCCAVACTAAAVLVPHMWPAAASALLILAGGWQLGNAKSSSSNSNRSGSVGNTVDAVSDTFVSWFHALVGCVGCIALYCC